MDALRPFSHNDCKHWPKYACILCLTTSLLVTECTFPSSCALQCAAKSPTASDCWIFCRKSEIQCTAVLFRSDVLTYSLQLVPRIRSRYCIYCIWQSKLFYIWGDVMITSFYKTESLILMILTRTWLKTNKRNIQGLVWFTLQDTNSGYVSLRRGPAVWRAGSPSLILEHVFDLTWYQCYYVLLHFSWFHKSTCPQPFQCGYVAVNPGVKVYWRMLLSRFKAIVPVNVFGSYKGLRIRMSLPLLPWKFPRFMEWSIFWIVFIQGHNIVMICHAEDTQVTLRRT